MNSSRSAGVRASQCRPSDRLAVSTKSKMSSAILRTLLRRSSARLSFLRSGSSMAFTTRSIWTLSWSEACPARAAVAGATTRASTTAMGTKNESTRTSCLNFPEHVLGDELLEIDRRFHLADAPARLDELLRRSRTDADEFLADEPLRLDRCDRVFLQLNIRVQPQHDVRLVVVQSDRLHAPDLDPGDLDAGPGL